MGIVNCKCNMDFNESKEFNIYKIFYIWSKFTINMKKDKFDFVAFWIIIMFLYILYFAISFDE